METAPGDDARKRFLGGLIEQLEADPGLLDRPGTTAFPREDRADSGVLVCYWAGRHAILWCDPALAAMAAGLADPDRPIDERSITSWASDNGFLLRAIAEQRVLAGPPTPPQPLDDAYRQRWLDGADPNHVAMVRAFADRNDPEEVEEAALDELDDFDEHAINVATTDRDQETIVAYASGCDWDWDPGFADIGVLVDPVHRGGGLGRFVVAATTQRLLAEGRLPLYRHGRSNLGSAAIAAGVGFEPVTSLAYFQQDPS